MENDSKISQALTTIRDFLEGQEWFQQLKAKWDELDVQSRMYLKLAGVGGAAFLLIFMVFSSAWSIHKLKRDVVEKNDLLTLIQSANDEMRRLRESVPGGTPGTPADNSPWPAYFDTIAAASSVDKATLTTSPEKDGTRSDTVKESLFDLSLKHVSIRSVIRYAFNLERGTRPIKLRNLAIDTKADPKGYLDATLSLSAFNLVTKP